MGKTSSKKVENGEEKKSTSTVLAEVPAQRLEVWLQALDDAMTQTGRMCTGVKVKLLLLLMASNRITCAFRGGSGSLAIRKVVSYLLVHPMDKVYAVLQTPRDSIEYFQAQASPWTPCRRQSLAFPWTPDDELLSVLFELVSSDGEYRHAIGEYLRVLIHPLEDLNRRRPCPLSVLARALEMIVHVQGTLIARSSITLKSLRILKELRTALPLMHLAYREAIAPAMDLETLHDMKAIFGPRPPKRKLLQPILSNMKGKDDGRCALSTRMLRTLLTCRLPRYTMFIENMITIIPDTTGNKGVLSLLRECHDVHTCGSILTKNSLQASGHY